MAFTTTHGPRFEIGEDNWDINASCFSRNVDNAIPTLATSRRWITVSKSCKSIDEYEKWFAIDTRYVEYIERDVSRPIERDRKTPNGIKVETRSTFHWISSRINRQRQKRRGKRHSVIKLPIANSTVYRIRYHVALRIAARPSISRRLMSLSSEVVKRNVK